MADKLTDKPKHPGGRPTDFKEEYIELAYKFCLLGADDKTLARYFDVTEQTINNWKIKVPEFFESIKRGKEIADAEIANALYHRAKGYEHKEDKIFNNNGSPLIVPTIKHYPPDTAAAFIWLKNRSNWRDKQEHEHSGGITVNMGEDKENPL